MDQKLNFEELADDIGVLTTKAQATLMYKIIPHFGPQMLRTIIRYSENQLNRINKPTPSTNYISTGDEKL